MTGTAFRKDKRDPYFLAPKRTAGAKVPSGRGDVPPLVRSVDRSLGYSLALIGAAIVAMRIIVDLL